MQALDMVDFKDAIDYYQILSNPILDIAATVWDDERYDAAKVCYRSMRVIDDLIDNRRSEGRAITKNEKQQFTLLVNNLMKALNDDTQYDELQEQLTGIIKKYKIPLWCWELFTKSMIYDIHHDGFKTFESFLEYSEGAAVAPASIFVHLCGVSKKNDQYKKPTFDILQVAKPAAHFCYMVHIIRDFQKDQLNNLNYFPDDLLVKNDLTRNELRQIAEGDEICDGFRSLMREYYGFAKGYKDQARSIIDSIGHNVEPRYKLSFEIIYNLYAQIFERIDVDNGKFTTEELNPTTEEVKSRIDHTIASFEKVK